MKTNRLIWALGWVTMGSLAALGGCGGDDEDGGGSGDGKGGKGGSSGSGTGGKATGGSSTGGKATGGSPTGGAPTGGSPTGGVSGTATGGAGGAPGGAGGEGGAGDPERVAACSSYCTPYFANGCDTFSTNTYSSADDCQNTCEGSDWPIGTLTPGNTIGCRLGNAALAVGAEQMTRCGYASENSTVCVD